MVVDDDMLIIGSQAILGTYAESALPDAAVASIEVDIAFLDDPDYAKGDLVDAVLGEMSEFHEKFGVYGQGVEVKTAVLPRGWRERVIVQQYPGVAHPVRFLEKHDLVISKLVAGREKDLDFASALIGAGLVTWSILLERAQSMHAELEPPRWDRLIQTVQGFHRSASAACRDL